MCLNKESISFVVITYLLTFILVYSLSSTSLFSYLITFIPGAVGVLLTIYNKQKIRDLFKLDSAKNLLYGIAIPLVIVPSVFGLSWLFSLVTYTSKNVEALEAIDNKVLMLVIMVVSGFIGALIGAVVSEIGWRGYLLRNLRGQISNFYIRALLMGLIWGIWSTVMFTITPFLLNYRELISLPIICIAFFRTCLMSIIYNWLFEKNDSIWPVVLASGGYAGLCFPFVLFIEVESLLSVNFCLLETTFYAFVVAGIVLFGEPNQKEV